MFAALFTSEKCDFDVCQACVKVMNMTPEEKKAEAKTQAAAAKREAAEAAAKRRRLEEKAEKEAEEKRRKKWDPKRQFKSRIIDPLEKNFSLEGNKTKDFTVWCSDGYDNDGWHSYEGPPDKDFDTTYATKEDANDRARYLFHWKNPRGMGPDDISKQEGDEKSARDGCVTYVVRPPDSSTWTVSVVPAAAYPYMEKASPSRHGYDVEHRHTSCDSALMGLCMEGNLLLHLSGA